MKGSSFKGFKTDSRHISMGGDGIDSVDIKVTEDYKELSMRLDGNNVDVEAEMASMAQNYIQYNTLTDRLNGKFRMLKSAISEGRK